MKKSLYSITFLVVMAVFSLELTSCKDDEPFVKPKLSFAQKTLTVNEADDVIEVEVILDKAFSEDIKVNYSLSGTAIEKVVAGTNSYDYEIKDDYLKLKILKGETVGKIEIQMYSDLEIEEDELIDIQIESVNNDQIEITRDDRLKITLVQEDGIATVLEWGTTAAGAAAPYTDVDMDILFWAPSSTTGELVLSGILAANGSPASPEVLFIPNAILDDGIYGFSYNYYESISMQDPMKFRVRFFTLINNQSTQITSANATSIKEYTKDNINPWFTSEVSPVLSQTVRKTGTTYSDFSEIIISDQGSRTSSPSQLPALERKDHLGKYSATILKSLLRD